MARRGLLIRTEQGVAGHMDFRDTKPEGLVFPFFVVVLANVALKAVRREWALRPAKASRR